MSGYREQDDNESSAFGLLGTIRDVHDREGGNTWQQFAAELRRVRVAAGLSQTTYWSEVDVVDLTGATLIDFDFANSHIGDVTFRAAQFHGETVFCFARLTKAEFADAEFFGPTSFQNARFTLAAQFNRARFSEDVVFSKVRIDGNGSFEETQFFGVVWFDDARLPDLTSLKSTRFHDHASFESAELRMIWLLGARFYGGATFHGSQLTEIKTDDPLDPAQPIWVGLDVPNSRPSSWPPGYIVQPAIHPPDEPIGRWSHLVRAPNSKKSTNAKKNGGEQRGDPTSCTAVPTPPGDHLSF
ncbi:pentapeptide repeat-containing protein [Kutzneria sp. 744]|uniref:pentapeptide repeat-containing protein n=1 Tax=Kutzneria sp. (strain 744) TaxID=345341 RepID=UPI0003EEA62B|nr:pentapeptide repeat-containing protein [Kutzneria sp. 744]EWM19806.1 hypothetical protein KUTG_10110 [Kutzneria sp. 744]